MAQIPDAIKEQYADAKKGLIVPWSPQQTVMAHKVHLILSQMGYL